MPMKLYANIKNNYKTYKVLITAKYAGLEIETLPEDQPQTGRMPVLETDEGCLFTSIAICRYLSRIRRDVGLYGQNLIEGGMIDSWVEFCTHELEVPLTMCFLPAMRPELEKNPEVEAKAKADVRRAMSVLNKHLLSNTFMVGDQITLADISIACSIYNGSSELDESYGNLLRWYNLMTSQPEFIAVLGEVKPPGGAKAPAPAKKAEAKEKKAPAPAAKKEKQAPPEKKAEPKKEGKKKDSKEEEKPKELSPEEIKKEKEKKLKKVIKEGGKRGVEIDGAADMGGLQFFCTSVDEPEGDLDLLNTCLDAMNAESDPTEEERKGGSGRIGKMIFSACTEHLAIIAYVPEALVGSIDTKEWLEKVLALDGGEVVSVTTEKGCKACGIVKANSDKGKFPLKMKEPCITEAITFLKAKGLFPDKDDDSDELVFGDDDFPS
jgi:glutathione S-transferase